MENKCKNCEEIIKDNMKFCNRSCSATYNNSKYPKRTKGRVKPNCKFCDKELDNYVKQYCNNSCQQEFLYNTVSIPKILKGEPISVNTRKRYINENIKEGCFECGIGEVWNKKPITLQLDHIDGNSDNNDLDNLRILCPNCHSQTETYGSKGNGNRYKKNTKRNNYLREYKS